MIAYGSFVNRKLGQDNNDNPWRLFDEKRSKSALSLDAQKSNFNVHMRYLVLTAFKYDDH